MLRGLASCLSLCWLFFPNFLGAGGGALFTILLQLLLILLLPRCWYYIVLLFPFISFFPLFSLFLPLKDGMGSKCI